MKLILEVSEDDGNAILEWVTKEAPLAPNGRHRVFVTSSVPALHMWNVQNVSKLDSESEPK